MKAQEIYTIKQKIWGVIMFLSLLWLTISLPFVYDAQQKLAKLSAIEIPLDNNPVENSEESNPLTNSVEEKTAGNSNILEEYIHHAHEGFTLDDPILSHIDQHSTDLYHAYHGELLSPPPESLLS